MPKTSGYPCRRRICLARSDAKQHSLGGIAWPTSTRIDPPWRKIMHQVLSNHKQSSRLLAKNLAALLLGTLGCGIPAYAQDFRLDPFNTQFFPGNLVVSRSVYDNKSANVKVGTVLPPNCASTTGGCSASTGAPYNGTYPFVFNNDIYDASFGITSAIYLDQITPFGWLINSLEVPNSSQRGFRSNSNELVTSFSSKSELALNLS